jgi:membrane associated rhomboid family serine protease
MLDSAQQQRQDGPLTFCSANRTSQCHNTLRKTLRLSSRYSEPYMNAIHRMLLLLGYFLLSFYTQNPFGIGIHAFHARIPLRRRHAHFMLPTISYTKPLAKDQILLLKQFPRSLYPYTLRIDDYNALFHKTHRSGSNTQWDGDDIRWIAKIQRNIQRSTYDWQNQPIRNFLIVSNIALFIYQCSNTIQYIRNQYPQSWSAYSLNILIDTIMGNSRPGPFTLQFVHSNLISIQQQQAYRFLTSGFLHGGLVHLVLNMDALRQLPSWLETGLGHALYITTYLLAIVGGNIFHSMTIVDRTTQCLGASGGICGLYGLMYVCLVRMGNHTAAWRVIRGMGLLFLWGMLLTNVSNAAHIGGFITGIVVAFLSGPTYRSSYGLRRKNSLEGDPYNRSYRTAMGFDKIPINRGIIPLPILYLAIFTAVLAQYKLHTMM